MKGNDLWNIKLALKIGEGFFLPMMAQELDNQSWTQLASRLNSLPALEFSHKEESYIKT